MNVLNPNIPDPELAGLMTDAGSKRADYQQSLLTSQLLLRTILDKHDSVAYRILQELAKQRGFDWNDFIRRIDMMAKHTPGRDAHFSFTDDFGEDIPLAEEMLVILDEGLSIAQSREEIKAGSGHILAAMAQQNVTTYGVLQRVGITSGAVIALLGEYTRDGIKLIRDYIEEAKQGNATPYFQRLELLRDAQNLLALKGHRHIILVGPDGAGKRTLAFSLAQILAANDDPNLYRSFVQINETALLDNPLAAMRAGLRRASGGILLLPGIDRFFADRLRAKFPEQVNREVHKALLGDEQVVIGTTTSAYFDQLGKERLIQQRTHRLDVPPATKDETIAMLGYHKGRLEREYEIEVWPEALETAANLANQYING
jgi:ATP-dependent Clp protease ATP-binding subunit ClpA